MSKYSFSKEEKLEIIKFYHEESYTLNEVARIFNVHRDTIKDWQNDYLYFGEEGLAPLNQQKTYSKEIKIAAVQDYLSGEFSLREVVRKYRLSSRTVLRNWVKKYTSHSELKKVLRRFKNRDGEQFPISIRLRANFLTTILLGIQSPKTEYK